VVDGQCWDQGIKRRLLPLTCIKSMSSQYMYMGTAGITCSTLKYTFVVCNVHVLLPGTEIYSFPLSWPCVSSPNTYDTKLEALYYSGNDYSPLKTMRRLEE
jgi:hypothetical protein